MGGVISFFIFFLLGILDTVFAVKLNLSPWKFLLAGNPRLPDGTRLYDMECFQRAAGMLCAIYAGVFYMTALFVLLTQIDAQCTDGRHAVYTRGSADNDSIRSAGVSGQLLSGAAADGKTVRVKSHQKQKTLWYAKYHSVFVLGKHCTKFVRYCLNPFSCRRSRRTGCPAGSWHRSAGRTSR